MGIRLPEGSDTPCSFAANITPEVVNYNGNPPYAGGEKGLYRQKLNPTAPTLPSSTTNVPGSNRRPRRLHGVHGPHFDDGARRDWVTRI